MLALEAHSSSVITSSRPYEALLSPGLILFSVSVPQTVLRDGDIDFCPPLPEPKLQAARSIGMSTALKVRLREVGQMPSLFRNYYVMIVEPFEHPVYILVGAVCTFSY